MSLGYRLKLLLIVANGAMPVVAAIVGVIAATASCLWVVPEREIAFRVAGTLLQGMGLATVALGIAQVRRLFGRPTVLGKVREWLRLLQSVFGKKRPISHELEIAVETGMAGSLRPIHQVPEGGPLHRRITALEKNLELFRREIDTTVAGLNSAIDDMRRTTKAGLAKRREETKAVDARMQEFATGGIHLELIGLLWLLAGVIAGTLAPELARM